MNRIFAFVLAIMAFVCVPVGGEWFYHDSGQWRLIPWSLTTYTDPMSDRKWTYLDRSSVINFEHGGFNRERYSMIYIISQEDIKEYLVVIKPPSVCRMKLSEIDSIKVRIGKKPPFYVGTTLTDKFPFLDTKRASLGLGWLLVESINDRNLMIEEMLMSDEGRMVIDSGCGEYERFPLEKFDEAYRTFLHHNE